MEYPRDVNAGFFYVKKFRRNVVLTVFTGLTGTLIDYWISKNNKKQDCFRKCNSKENCLQSFEH